MAQQHSDIAADDLNRPTVDSRDSSEERVTDREDERGGGEQMGQPGRIKMTNGGHNDIQHFSEGTTADSVHCYLATDTTLVHYTSRNQT